MKLICIADTHSYHHDVKVPDGDVLIHAGDLTMVGSLHELLDFNDWMEKQPHNYKIVIAGNHDRALGQSPMLGYKMLTNCIYLQNSGVELDGVNFWGSPYTPAFQGMRSGLTFYTNSDREAKGIWRGMSKKTDVLITHGPPFGKLDKVKRHELDQSITFENVGDQMLMEKVKKIKPKYHIFGHIHEEYGLLQENGTTFINASVVNAEYNVVNKPIVVKI